VFNDSGNGGRTEEHGAHVGNAREQVDTPVLEHDGVYAVVDEMDEQRRRIRTR